MINRPLEVTEIYRRIATIDERFKYLQHPRTTSISIQVTDDCCLRCTYCYQINKGHEYLTFATAKQIADFLFREAERDDSILSYKQNIGIILDFIGGEPLLNFTVVAQFIDYFEEQLIKRNSPWILYHMYNFSSNGVLYFEPLVQEYIRKYPGLLSLSITVDGNKTLHDSCRVFPDGSGSYDLAVRAALDQLHKYHNRATKITLAPANIKYVSDAVINMFELGFDYVHANCCYEDIWDIKDATTLYQQLKIVADYIIDKNLEPVIGFNMFETNNYNPTDLSAHNWCGGTGEMLGIDTYGNIYPCLRYAPISLGNDQPPLIIGHISRSFYETPEEKKILAAFEEITLQSQSPPECLTCPVGQGCSWCSAYNYQKFGTANKRSTYICNMHKACAFATYYFWHKNQQVHGTPTDFTVNLPMEDIEAIIGIDEWNYLQNL